MEGFRKILDRELKDDLAANGTATANTHRGKSDAFGAHMVLDGNPETYWATDDGVTSGFVDIEMDKPQTLKYIQLQEYIKLGQRVKSFKVEAWHGNSWKLVAEATTVGYKRILKLEPTETNKVRITILASKACPLISNISLF